MNYAVVRSLGEVNNIPLEVGEITQRPIGKFPNLRIEGERKWLLFLNLCS